MKAYVIYENPDWMPPLRRELRRAGVPFEEWFTHEGSFDLTQTPPQGVYINRMSASSHTREHTSSVAFTWELLAWLEGNGRRVINGSRAFALEISKVRQYEALRLASIRVPHTVAVAGGAAALREAAYAMPTPFITKHNRGGKGLGVRLFRSHEEFDAHLDSGAFELPIDHLTLLQEYVQSPEPFITRVELVGDRFLYALKSDTSRGFQLCPAEGCESDADPQAIFSLREGFDDPLVAQYAAFMAANGIDVAGIEFIENDRGEKITYDINGTTNYSPAVEARFGFNGMAQIAQLVAAELDRQSSRVQQPLPIGGLVPAHQD